MILFMVGLFACHWGAKEQDRPLWGCLLVMGVVSMAKNALLSDWSSYNEPLVSQGIETLTLCLIFQTAKTVTATRMVFLIAAAWVAHSLLYLGFQTGKEFPYEIYIPALYSIAVLQLALGANGITRRIIRIYQSSFRMDLKSNIRRGHVSWMETGKSRGGEAEG